MPRLQIMDRVRRVFLAENPDPNTSPSAAAFSSEPPGWRRPKHWKSESALRSSMQPRDEGAKKLSAPVLVTGVRRPVSVDAPVLPPLPPRRPAVPAPKTQPLGQAHLPKQVQTAAVEIVAEPCTPAPEEPAKMGPGSLIHLVEQQIGFMNEQQNIISQLVRHLEWMESLLQSQRSSMVKRKPLPPPPPPPQQRAETKDATTSTSPTPIEIPTPPRAYCNPDTSPTFRHTMSPHDYPLPVSTATPRSSYGPPVSLQSDESAAALDRIAEEIADSYDALSLCSQHTETAACDRNSSGRGHSVEFRHSAYASVTPPTEFSGSPRASSSHHQVPSAALHAPTDFAVLNKAHNTHKFPSRSATDMHLVATSPGQSNPESPVLPKSTGELTPPLSPTEATPRTRLAPPARERAMEDGTWGQLYPAPDGRLCCRMPRPGKGLQEGGFI